MKTCKCGSTGPFSIDRAAKDGLSRLCVECDRSRRNALYAAKPEVVARRALRAERAAARQREDEQRIVKNAARLLASAAEKVVAGNSLDAVLRGMLRGARERAKDRGLPIDLDLPYLRSVWSYTCPVLGCALVSGTEEHWNSPTLDRLVPERGYVRGNVAVISRRANAIKSDATPGEIARVLAWVAKVTP